MTLDEFRPLYARIMKAYDRQDYDTLDAMRALGVDYYETMRTLAGCLCECGFDWATGRVLYRDGANAVETKWLAAPWDAHELFLWYRGGVIAEDACAIYVGATYDGSNWIERIEKDISVYASTPLPRLGGG